MHQRFARFILTAALIGGWAGRAQAHPMGNFSINHYAALQLEGNELHLRYRIDIAELPSVEEMRSLDADDNGEISDAERAAYLARQSAKLISGLTLSINGKPASLYVATSAVEKRPGAADLPTLLITLDCFAAVATPGAPPAQYRIEFSDDNYRGRAGWKEVIATACEGWRFVETDVPARDASHALEAYPSDLTIAPPQLLAARLVAAKSLADRPTMAMAAPGAGTQAVPPVRTLPRTPQDRFTQLITAKTLSPVFIMLSLAVAFGLGSLHALAPGHGKTVVAAYLVGSRGTLRHAMLLGAVVTLTHVSGVFILGFIVLFLSRYIIPEQLYPWLGFASGMMIVLVGAQQFVQRRATYIGGVGGHSHDPSQGGHTHQLPDRLSIGSLIAMGVSGGMVPCPSALVVLLGAIALGRVGFGLVLIVVFSLGLAAVLIAIGVLILYAKRWIERFRWAGGSVWARRLPLVSSAAVAILGLVIAIQSLVGAGVIGPSKTATNTGQEGTQAVR